MEIGAIFILLIVIAVVAVLGGLLFLLLARLRGRELDPDGNRLAGVTDPDQAGAQAGTNQAGSDGRPEHVEVEREQRERFVGSR
jgi:hypothetical protein